MQPKCYNCGGLGNIARNCKQPKRPQNSDYFKDKMLLMQAQENGAMLNEEDLAFLAGDEGNTFDADMDDKPIQDLVLNDPNIQADDSDAIDSDVADEPTAQTIFMANLSFAVSSPHQSSPSNSSVIFEVLKLYDMCDRVDEPKISYNVQQTNVIQSNAVELEDCDDFLIKQHVNYDKEAVAPCG